MPFYCWLVQIRIHTGIKNALFIKEVLKGRPSLGAVQLFKKLFLEGYSFKSLPCVNVGLGPEGGGLFSVQVCLIGF